MKKQTLLCIAVSLGYGSAAFANHPDPPMITPPASPQPQAVSAPPVVPRVPTPVPPANFQLPASATPSPSTILPTDVSGFQASDSFRLSPTELKELLSKDERFRFTGEWISFSSNYSAKQPESPYKKVSSLKQTNTKFGRVEQSDRSSAQATFMPTVGAKFERVDGAHLKLLNGAAIVRGADQPVFVSTRLCDEDVIAKIGGNALAVVSAFDSKPTVLNLTDASDNAVMLYPPTPSSSKMQSIKLKPGQIAEAYKLDSKPTSNLVAKRISLSQQIGPHCGLLVSECHYARALRKFNLVASLPKDQYKRVLKTAASLEHVNR